MKDINTMTSPPKQKPITSGSDASLTYLWKCAGGVTSVCAGYCLELLETYIRLVFFPLHVFLFFLSCDFTPEDSEM